MPAPTSIAPRRNWMASINVDNGAGLRQSIQAALGNVPTTGGIWNYVIAPEDGFLHSVDFSFEGALAANDTNYVSFVITNLGQGGTGNTTMTATSDANTTKLTGGSAIVINAKRSLVLSSSINNLKVAAGDRLKLHIIVTGTLGGAIGSPLALVRFSL